MTKAESKKAFKKVRNGLNGFLANLGRRYHETLPLGDIAAAMELVGVEMAESFILTGRDGCCTVPLTYREQAVADHVLALSWHRLDVTGRYEVVAYIS